MIFTLFSQMRDLGEDPTFLSIGEKALIVRLSPFEPATLAAKNYFLFFWPIDLSTPPSYLYFHLPKRELAAPPLFSPSRARRTNTRDPSRLILPPARCLMFHLFPPSLLFRHQGPSYREIPFEVRMCLFQFGFPLIFSSFLFRLVRWR